MVLAAFYSSASVAALFMAILSWVLFWGALSAAVQAILGAPNLHSLWMGLAGPFGPLIALGVGMTGRRTSSPDQVIDVEGRPSSSGPRALP